MNYSSLATLIVVVGGTALLEALPPKMVAADGKPVALTIIVPHNHWTQVGPAIQISMPQPTQIQVRNTDKESEDIKEITTQLAASRLLAASEESCSFKRRAPTDAKSLSPWKTQEAGSAGAEVEQENN
jgi:hypothetical protein